MIRVKEISRTFYDGRKNINALLPITFDVHAGEVFGLLGPNGAGKTTLLRILSTVIRPSTGTAILNGFDIRENANEVKMSIGLLSGNTKLYGRLTPKELLLYFGKLYGLSDAAIRGRIGEILKLLDITEFADRRIEKLSTGQMQRVSIARCILHDPAIFILDEPTLGLDIMSSRTIIEFIKHSAINGKTVLFSTHYMEEAEQLCNRIGFLHKGGLLAVDTLANHRRQSELNSVGDIFMHYVSRAKGEAA